VRHLNRDKEPKQKKAKKKERSKLSFGDDEEEDGEDGEDGDGAGAGGKMHGKKKRVNGDTDGGVWLFLSFLSRLSCC
jgi:hypothetical protein